MNKKYNSSLIPPPSSLKTTLLALSEKGKAGEPKGGNEIGK
jgi:hypothetical protein